MRLDINGRQVELEPNSKPYLLKRLLADGFDTAVLFVLFLVLTALILQMPLADTYHDHFDRYKAIEEETASALGNDAEAVSEALSGNDAYQNELFAASLHGYLLKAAACFLAEALLLLAFPLLNKTRSTPGKLLTGIMPFNQRRQSRATAWQILFRFLFIFFIDSLAFYLYTGILTFLLVPLLRLTELLVSRKKNKTICDYMTGVMMIEKLSYDGIN